MQYSDEMYRKKQLTLLRSEIIRELIEFECLIASLGSILFMLPGDVCTHYDHQLLFVILCFPVTIVSGYVIFSGQLL